MTERPSPRRHRILGPGLLVAATGVGAGDLATGAFTGSQLGVVVLWAAVVGAGLKYALTEGLALELAPEILVNAIAPGPIIPPSGLGDEGNREVLKATPLGRWGGAAEIAKVVQFLIESDFVTGETIRVDGGRHLN